LDDVTIPALHCLECNGKFFRKSANGPIPRRCPDCARARQREQTRQGSIRRWAEAALAIEMTFICQDCEGTFERQHRHGPTPKRCKSCIAEEAKAHSRRCSLRSKVQSAAAFEKTGRTSICDDCGTRIDCSRMGPKTRRCRPCRLRRRTLREHTPVVPTPIRCLDCGKMTNRTAYGMRRKRCSECTRHRSSAMWAKANPEKRREVYRRARHVRRARIANAGFERFSEFEVFERDCWKCGICNKRINKRLKYPNPMSVSLDHVIPVSQGGPHTRANTRAAHLACNVRRQANGGNEQLALVG
jgi:hypothetical protein